MERNIYFDQCMDFLARMIEKYGGEIEFPEETEQQTETDIEEYPKSA